MSEADKMFKELGYEIDSTYETKEHLFYCKNHVKFDFDLNRKDLYKYNISDYRCPIDMQELQAINKKCEELGWK